MNLTTTLAAQSVIYNETPSRGQHISIRRVSRGLGKLTTSKQLCRRLDNQIIFGTHTNVYDAYSSAGSILDILKYRDTCERSISILRGIAILRYIEYRMIRRYLSEITYDPEYRPIRNLKTTVNMEALPENIDIAIPTTDSSIINTSD